MFRVLLLGGHVPRDHRLGRSRRLRLRLLFGLDRRQQLLQPLQFGRVGRLVALEVALLFQPGQRLDLFRVLLLGGHVPRDDGLGRRHVGCQSPFRGRRGRRRGRRRLAFRRRLLPQGGDFGLQGCDLLQLV